MVISLCTHQIQPALAAVILGFTLSACNTGAVTTNRSVAQADFQGSNRGKIVFLAGPDSHGAGQHEHKAGSELLAGALQQRYPGFETVNVYGGWPEDEAVFTNADAVVIYCDGGRGHLISEHLDSFNRLLDKKVGVVALHYAVEVPRGSAAAGSMLRATGGYFETDWSVNPHWEANFTAFPEHPITQGIKPFKQQDEWYFNMRFVHNKGEVTPILSAIAPMETMSRSNGKHSGNDAIRKLVADGVPQVVAWAFERDDGGRGFGYTGGHFHAGWEDDNTRNLVLNAIVWTASKDENKH